MSSAIGWAGWGSTTDNRAPAPTPVEPLGSPLGIDTTTIPVGGAPQHPDDPIASMPGLLDTLTNAPAAAGPQGPVGVGSGAMTPARSGELGSDPNPNGLPAGVLSENRRAIENSTTRGIVATAPAPPILIGDASGIRISTSRNPDGSPLGQYDPTVPNVGRDTTAGPPGGIAFMPGPSSDPISLPPVDDGDAPLGDPSPGNSVTGNVPGEIGGVTIPAYVRAQGLAAARAYAAANGYDSTTAPPRPTPQRMPAVIGRKNDATVNPSAPHGSLALPRGADAASSLTGVLAIAAAVVVVWMVLK